MLVYEAIPPTNRIDFTIGINTISFNQGGTPGLSSQDFTLEAAEGSPVQSSGTTSLINNATEKVRDQKTGRMKLNIDGMGQIGLSIRHTWTQCHQFHDPSRSNSEQLLSPVGEAS